MHIVRVAMVDWDGVIVDSISGLTRVGMESVAEIFPTDNLDGKVDELIAYFGGGSFASGFKDALKSLYPGEENKQKIEDCCQIALAKREKVYDQAKPFPGALKALQKIARNYRLVISSACEQAIIDNWLKRNGFAKGLFDAIYTLDDGGKDIHVQKVRKEFHGAIVLYAGDSCSDMKLVDLSIGVTESLRIRKRLFEEGARAVVKSIRSLEGALNVLSGHKEIFLCGRAAS